MQGNGVQIVKKDFVKTVKNFIDLPKIISIIDFQRIKDVVVSQECKQHGKHYDLYCTTHDTVLCIACVDHHKSCSQVIPLIEASAHAKQFAALADLEDTINWALEDTKTNIKAMKLSAEAFDTQEENIKKYKKEMREKLNQRLHDMEQKLTVDLSTKSECCKTAYANIIKQLILADNKLAKLKKDTESLKQIASDE
ncbi:zinc-binding protein A33-like [Mytilus californianus]|uniref:zinc-binding protein A33-like n=1 Tax=Mytilus californianus TaxID=6549 RepID=UPI0022465A33|nr:zinc-binding protein A33-like [Mytilus californianus]